MHKGGHQLESRVPQKVSFLSEGKCRLVKNNMARYDDAVSVEVKAPITLVVGRVANEDAQRGSRGKFVGGGGGEVGIARATKRAKIVIGWEGAMKGKERGAHVEGFCGKAIYDMGGGGKGICPVEGGHGSLKE